MEDGGVAVERKRGWGGCLKFLAFTIVVLAAIGAGFWYVGDSLKRQFLAPSPETVAMSSLQSLREQNRLSTFQARYVAVVTSKQNRLGLTAQKTMIMPGTVRYEVDLSKLEQKDLSWDAATNKLTIRLPSVEVVGPEIDMEHIREYGEGGILMALTNAEEALDAANRKAAQDELVRQAREPMPMKMARDATKRAIERSFSMPLRAAGMNAISVQVLFPGEGGSEVWDMSRRPEDVLRNSR
jgi:hypothetical protein